ncbi:MAG: STAS domain-containing protein [bacterium]|nr:STAS domain-containing protein [bacterium]
MKIIKNSTPDGDTILKINGDMTIYSARGFKDLLLKYIESSSALALDLSGVGKIDTAGFQLLILGKREAEKAGKNLKVVNPSLEVSRLFNLYGETIE